MDYGPYSKRDIWKKPKFSNQQSHTHQTCCECISHQPLLAWIFWTDSTFWPPWTIVKGNFGRAVFEGKQKRAKSPKLERPCPPKLVHIHNSSMLTCINFLNWFWKIDFFDDHGLYSPWSEREIWPFFRVAISPKPKKPRPPKLVYMHVTSRPTCINFLSRFRLIKFFGDHGLL